MSKAYCAMERGGKRPRRKRGLADQEAARSLLVMSGIASRHASPRQIGHERIEHDHALGGGAKARIADRRHQSFLA